MASPSDFGIIGGNDFTGGDGIPVPGGGGGGGGTPDGGAPGDALYLIASADSRLLDAIVYSGPIIPGSSPPANTAYLWLDTSGSPSVLKYFESVGATWNILEGTIWYSGSGVPSGGTGNNGDYYLRTSNGAVYLKTSGTWSVIMNLTGPTGATGSTGATGPIGSVGLTMPSGFTVTGSPLTANGTLAVTADAQSANAFYRGPVSGGAVAPHWGDIVAADIPLDPVIYRGGYFTLIQIVTPTASTTDDFEFELPYNMLDGTSSLTWHFTRVDFRAKTAPVTSPATMNIAKNGSNIFASNLSLAAGSHGMSTNSFTTTSGVSGDLMQVVYGNVNSSDEWSVFLTAWCTM
jgi:hypothetical protein